MEGNIISGVIVVVSLERRNINLGHSRKSPKSAPTGDLF